jgi:hypothetical protein
MSDVGRYRRLYVRLWRHPGFAALTDSEKVLAIYLLTGPQSNRVGLYMLSIATAAEDLETVSQTLSKRLVTVCQTFGWLFDKRSRVLFIPSWFRWNPPDNENVMKGALKDLNEIPPCGLIDAFARNIGTVPATLQATFAEGLRQRLPNGTRTQDQETVTGTKRQEQKPSARSAGFEPRSSNGHNGNQGDVSAGTWRSRTKHSNSQVQTGPSRTWLIHSWTFRVDETAGSVLGLTQFQP